MQCCIGGLCLWSSVISLHIRMTLYYTKLSLALTFYSSSSNDGSGTWTPANVLDLFLEQQTHFDFISSAINCYQEGQLSGTSMTWYAYHCIYRLLWTSSWHQHSQGTHFLNTRHSKDQTFHSITCSTPTRPFSKTILLTSARNWQL